MTPIQKWVNEMQSIWLEKRPDDIATILAEPLEYYETPFDPPLETIEEIIKEWQVIKSQNIELVNISILFESDNTGVATWEFKENNEPLHKGCYFIQLDEEGKCHHFRQWWGVEAET